MKQVRWTAYDGKVCVGVGTVAAEGEREALEAVLSGKAKNFKPRPDRWYTVRAGGVTASSLGSEMGAVASQAGKDAQQDSQQVRSNHAVEQAARKVMQDALKKTASGRSKLQDAADKFTNDSNFGGMPKLDADKIFPKHCSCSMPVGVLGDDGEYICNGCKRPFLPGTHATAPVAQIDPLDCCPANRNLDHTWEPHGMLGATPLKRCIACGCMRPVGPLPGVPVDVCSTAPDNKHDWGVDGYSSATTPSERCLHCGRRRPKPRPKFQRYKDPYDVSRLSKRALQVCHERAIEVGLVHGIHGIPDKPSRGWLDLTQGVTLEYDVVVPSGATWRAQISASEHELEYLR